jgi:hypothetical protein
MIYSRDFTVAKGLTANTGVISAGVNIPIPLIGKYKVEVVSVRVYYSGNYKDFTSDEYTVVDQTAIRGQMLITLKANASAYWGSLAGVTFKISKKE